MYGGGYAPSVQHQDFVMVMYGAAGFTLAQLCTEKVAHETQSPTSCLLHHILTIVVVVVGVQHASRDGLSIDAT